MKSEWIWSNSYGWVTFVGERQKETMEKKEEQIKNY